MRRPAAQPDGLYQPEEAPEGAAQPLVVRFCGEDGRRRSFDLGGLPLPGWHMALARAWAGRIGATGSLRTSTSAQTEWANLCRLVRFLAVVLDPPTGPAELTAAHVDAFGRHRETTVGPVMGARELRSLAVLFREEPLCNLVPVAALDRFRLTMRGKLASRPGYSDREFQQIVAAARADVASLRDRLDTSEILLDRHRRAPGSLNAEELKRAAALGPMAGCGVASVPPGGATQTLERRRLLAEQLFVTRRDLAALLVLLVVTTGLNVEAVKELPAEHRILEGRAVEVVVIKRRRGPGRWHNTVTWEIGPPGRELHTPGGVYLLTHRLMARGRGFAPNPSSFWALWHNTQWHNTQRAAVSGHRDPFADKLNASVYAPAWVNRHDLRADQVADVGEGPSSVEAPGLGLDFIRLRTSVEVRRTRQLGGHLPSAARTNTMAVLFRNYLLGDATTIDWAQQVVSEAFADVEQAARDAHRRAQESSGQTPRVVSGDTSVGRLTAAGLDPASAERAANGELDTAWSACADHDHHPLSGETCRSSFLDCFGCGNCLITRDHLPRLLSLLEALNGRRAHMSDVDWWRRYGATWAAIRFDVLTKFSPAEVADAHATRGPDALLDLVEPTWEQP